MWKRREHELKYMQIFIKRQCLLFNPKWNDQVRRYSVLFLDIFGNKSVVQIIKACDYEP